MGHTAEYWKGVEEGKKHITSSPETLRRFENLEILTKTNKELLVDIRNDYSNHIKDDAVNFQEIKDSMILVATKQDIKEMKEAFEEFTRAISFLKVGGRIGYRVLLVFATIMVSIVAIGGGFKTILNWFIK